MDLWQGSAIVTPVSECKKTTSAWVYPFQASKQVREYQLQAVHQALQFNTLVCIPTGCGKTLIASAVIYNYYRWFPKGLIFFLAPTRPLVTQQSLSLVGIKGINPDDAVELTGGDLCHNRAKEYQVKRIFFMTPQTLENDLEKGIIDVRNIVLIIYGKRGV